MRKKRNHIPRSSGTPTASCLPEAIRNVVGTQQAREGVTNVDGNENECKREQHFKKSLSNFKYRALHPCEIEWEVIRPLTLDVRRAIPAAPELRSVGMLRLRLCMGGWRVHAYESPWSVSAGTSRNTGRWVWGIFDDASLMGLPPPLSFSPFPSTFAILLEDETKGGRVNEWGCHRRRRGVVEQDTKETVFPPSLRAKLTPPLAFETDPPSPAPVSSN
ncbi:hypothetical protein BDQ17DRAFT_1331855 [Cyathus striatus]|nr:hypothetical protein BDQ17DRAFT_1331855 [Cyathus striatus]